MQEASESESQVGQVPHFGTVSSFASIQSNDRKSQFSVIDKKVQLLDEEAILEFLKEDQPIKARTPQMRRQKSKKAVKVQAKTSKRYDISIVRRKYQAQIQSLVSRYRHFIKQQRSHCQSLHQQTLYEFAKMLSLTVYQLLSYSSQPQNDINQNQRRIIAESADVFGWTKGLVEEFQKEFRNAEVEGRIRSAREKWDALIKNLRDQTNFQLRRKILRKRVKPAQVLKQEDSFLWSRERKDLYQSAQRLILTQAEKDFLDDDGQPIVQEQRQQELPDDLHMPVQLPSNSYLDKKLSQQKEKLNQWMECVEQAPERLRNRIFEDLKGTQSYDRIMKNFQQNFMKS